MNTKYDDIARTVMHTYGDSLAEYINIPMIYKRSSPSVHRIVYGDRKAMNDPHYIPRLVDIFFIQISGNRCIIGREKKLSDKYSIGILAFLEKHRFQRMGRNKWGPWVNYTKSIHVAMKEILRDRPEEAIIQLL